MPMTVIPYARHQPYRNDAYTRAMADLLLRRGDVAAELALRRGAGSAATWNNVGQTTMATMAAIGNQRDEERNLAAAQAERDRAHALKMREMDERTADRRADEAWRQGQFRDASARNAADDLVPGETISPEDYTRSFAGTSASRRFRRVPGQPEEPMVYGPDYAGPTKPATPERYARVPNWTEQKQDDQLELQIASARIAMQNTLADNLRADEAAANTREFREEMLRTRNFIAEAARDQKKLTNMFTLSGAVKSHPAYTKMLDFESGLQAVEAGLQQGNGLGDIAAINAFQRLVDPGVSVREGDVRLLESAIALGSKLSPTFWADKLRGGDRLPEDMRVAMQQASRDLYTSRAKTYAESVGDMFKQQANAASVPYALIARDFPIPDFRPTTRTTGSGGGFFGDPNRQPKPKQ